MSTRSRIGFRQSDGSIRSIYCHHDGYLSWNGLKLHTFYPNFHMATELVKLGNISSLKDNIAPLPGQLHTFDNPAPNVTVAYDRDRGETESDSRVDADVDTFLANNEEFAYLFEVGQWWVWCLNDNKPRKMNLAAALVADGMVPA